MTLKTNNKKITSLFVIAVLLSTVLLVSAGMESSFAQQKDNDKLKKQLNHLGYSIDESSNNGIPTKIANIVNDLIGKLLTMNTLIEGNSKDIQILSEIVDSNKIQIGLLLEQIDTLQSMHVVVEIPEPTPEPVVTVSANKSEYKIGETVVISGHVTNLVNGGVVTIQLFNSQGSLVDIAQTPVAQDGSYSHTVIAEGPLWKTGEYTVKVSYGEGITAETKFRFTA